MPRPIRVAYTIPAGAQFGAPRGNGTRIHQGCDYHCPIGTPIYGTGEGGKVIAIGYNGDPITGSGNNVVIQYGNRITTDMHLRERTPLHVGSLVNADTIVGYVGITGNAVNADPPGSHDHHQMTLNGKLTDPESFYGTTTAGTGTPITEEDDMPTYELIRAANDLTVWFAVDRIQRYGLPSEQALKDYQFFIRQHGQSDTTLYPVNLDSFGTPVFKSPAPPTVDTANIVQAIVAALGPQITGTVDVAKIAKAVNDDAAARLAA